jgi:hypothetical protein
VRPPVSCLGLVALMSCSLLVDDLSLSPCSTRDDCEQANRALNVAATALRRYQCVASRCALSPRDDDGDGDPAREAGGRDCDDHDALRVGDPINPRAREVCDGVDNDCDGLVDEGVIGPRNAGEAVQAVAAGERVAWSHGAAGDLTAAIVSDTRVARMVTVRGASAADAAQVVYRAHTSDNLDEPVRLQSGCWVVTSAGPVFEQCDVGEMALDEVPGAASYFAVAVNRAGCDRGQIRVGRLDASAGARGAFEQIGPAARSNVFAGVAVDPTTRCTGAGASRPAVASLRAGETPRALAAWVSSSAASAAACGAAPAEVMGLGLWLVAGSAGGAPVRWVAATQRATPQSLGQTAGSVAPSIVAWDEVGWFVAMSDGQGRAALRFVSALSATVPVGDSPPLAADAAPSPLPSGGAADHVRVALSGRPRADGRELGVVWTEGCGPAASVWFARVLYRTSPAPAAFVASTPVRVAERGSDPVVAWSAAAALAPGSMRGGATVPAEQSGAWTVAWIERGEPERVLARRMSEVDGAAIDEAPTELGSTSGQGARSVALVAEERGALRYAWHDRQRGAVIGGGLLCVAGR